MQKNWSRRKWHTQWLAGYTYAHVFQEHTWSPTFVTRVRERSRFLKSNTLWNVKVATRVRERSRFLSLKVSWSHKSHYNSCCFWPWPFHDLEKNIVITNIFLTSRSNAPLHGSGLYLAKPYTTTSMCLGWLANKWCGWESWKPEIMFHKLVYVWMHE